MSKRPRKTEISSDYSAFTRAVAWARDSDEGSRKGERPDERAERAERAERDDPQAGRMLFEALATHSIVAVTDAGGEITYVNGLFCEISGYSREELIGQDHRILNSGMHSKQFFCSMWQCILGGSTWRGTFRNRRKDGSHYWVQTVIHPVMAKGKASAFVSIRTDVTEIVEAREQIEGLNSELRKASERLDFERASLDRKNTALEELIDKIERDRDQVKIRITTNYEILVQPILDKIATKLPAQDHIYLNLLRRNLEDLTEPFTSEYIDMRLTPKEIQVCDQIRGGLTVKEIAAIHNLSPRTIEKHRENIRRKLGLVDKKVNLVTYLMSKRKQ